MSSGDNQPLKKPTDGEEQLSKDMKSLSVDDEQPSQQTDSTSLLTTTTSPARIVDVSPPPPGQGLRSSQFASEDDQPRSPQDNTATSAPAAGLTSHRPGTLGSGGLMGSRFAGGPTTPALGASRFAAPNRSSPQGFPLGPGRGRGAFGATTTGPFNLSHGRGGLTRGNMFTPSPGNTAQSPTQGRGGLMGTSSHAPVAPNPHQTLSSTPSERRGSLVGHGVHAPPPVSSPPSPNRPLAPPHDRMNIWYSAAFGQRSNVEASRGTPSREPSTTPQFPERQSEPLFGESARAPAAGFGAPHVQPTSATADPAVRPQQPQQPEHRRQPSGGFSIPSAEQVQRWLADPVGAIQEAKARGDTATVEAIGAAMADRALWEARQLEAAMEGVTDNSDLYSSGKSDNVKGDLPEKKLGNDKKAQDPRSGGGSGSGSKYDLGLMD
ncbi:hypothetical protein BCR34DRAFT_31838 [Clohesyomyces aquaticus]|uniref:Uncharacterized protein n=1 Tax=Clohesyomyces aquaticus TaxID=1231657 RepID=A0A1Y1Z8N7_9PLEO|nr:hypothetical protein BCR34DRAFT_31838 [Clohesyomyces aquaticus]